MAPDADLRPGAAFAGYRLEERLGGGGFGEVWRATEIATGHLVAVKVLTGRYAAAESERLRIEVELLAAAAVGRDPHVVAVLGGGVEPAPHIAMEYVPGESLATVLDRQGPLSVSETARIGLAIATALVSLSRAGIVHRDLKAANVLLGSNGAVKLADFGIAKIVGFDSLTATGQLPMSLHYAAPEVWEGKGGEPADRYAFGILLYECLTGHPPFSGTYAEVYRGHRDVEPDLTALPADTPADLRSLIAECLAKEPGQRPAENAEVEARMEAIAAAIATAEPPRSPAAFGPWRLVAPHPTRAWAWRAEQDGRYATVDVVFGDAATGESLRAAVSAAPEMARLGAELLLGSNRLILRPGEAWDAGMVPGGPFAFWVASDELPAPSGQPPLDRRALERAVLGLGRILDVAAEHGIAVDLGPDRLSVLQDGAIFVRRPGVPEPFEPAARTSIAAEAAALAMLRAQAAPGTRPLVDGATSLADLADRLGVAPSKTVGVDRRTVVAVPAPPAGPPPAVPAGPPPAVPGTRNPSPAGGPPDRSRRRRLGAVLLVGSAAILALSVVGAAALLAGRPGSSPGPSQTGSVPIAGLPSDGSVGPDSSGSGAAGTSGTPSQGATPSASPSSSGSLPVATPNGGHTDSPGKTGTAFPGASSPPPTISHGPTFSTGPTLAPPTNPPPTVAPDPNPDLIVSTDLGRSSDGVAHGAGNPFYVPLGARYHNVVVDAGAYVTAGGTTLRFSATGSLTVNGVITMDGKGYAGGTGAPGRQGSSYPGTATGQTSSAANGGGGGGGMDNDCGGAGGGYGSAGENGHYTVSCQPGARANGGGVYGDSLLSVLYPGSGGGASWNTLCDSGCPYAPGGAGGGVIDITAASITVSSTGLISANGQQGGSEAQRDMGYHGGGGGSGGSIRLTASALSGANRVVANGGAGGYGHSNSGDCTGGAGGLGRVRWVH